MVLAYLLSLHCGCNAAGCCAFVYIQYVWYVYVHIQCWLPTIIDADVHVPNSPALCHPMSVVSVACVLPWEPLPLPFWCGRSVSRASTRSIKCSTINSRTKTLNSATAMRLTAIARHARTAYREIMVQHFNSDENADAQSHVAMSPWCAVSFLFCVCNSNSFSRVFPGFCVLK